MTSGSFGSEFRPCKNVATGLQILFYILTDQRYLVMLTTGGLVLIEQKLEYISKLTRQKDIYILVTLSENGQGEEITRLKTLE